MSKPWRCGFMSAAALLLMFVASTAQAASAECNDAWAAYNEFKSRSSMEASQYPLTSQAAAVRAACGKNALPAPANADRPPRHHVRRQRMSLESSTTPVAPLTHPVSGRSRD